MNRYRSPFIIYLLLLVLGISGCALGNSVTSNNGVTIIEPIETSMPGQSDAGAAADDSVATDASAQEPSGNSDAGPVEASAALSTYRDDILPFVVSYPQGFVLQPLSDERLNLLDPKPEAGLRILNPDAAASALGDMEIADLELRIYQNAETTTLEAWLATNGFLPVDGGPTAQPFATDHLTGLELCSTMLMAPGCAYFAAAGGNIYQMIPATQEGEAILQTIQVDSTK